jgi:drug/metabolite transporter (DMT)-like permease
MDVRYHLLGQFFALLTAILWACALVLFKVSGERVGPIALNLYKNAVGLTLLGLTVAVELAVGWVTWQQITDWHYGDYMILLLSGVIGIAIADSVFFYALNLIGVGLMSVVDCAYSPLVILFGFLLLCETLTPFHYAGAALIIVGVFVASRHPVPVNRTRRQIVLGMFLGAAAVGMMAFGIVLAKPILEGFPLVLATAVRMFAGTLFLSLTAMLGRNWQRHWTIFKPSRAWRAALPGSILGSYVCMILWVGGFKYTYAAVAGVLNQTSVIFASVLAAIFLKEHFGGRKIAALTFAVIGVMIVMTARPLWARVIAALG